MRSDAVHNELLQAAVASQSSGKGSRLREDISDLEQETAALRALQLQLRTQL